MIHSYSGLDVTQSKKQFTLLDINCCQFILSWKKQTLS